MSTMREDMTMLCRAAIAQHDAEWDSRKSEIKLAKALYATRYWKEVGLGGVDGVIRVESGDGRAYVDQYVGSLFSRDPAVEVAAPRDAAPGDAQHVPPEAVQALLNGWMSAQREVIEISVKAMLLFPGAFARVSAIEGKYVAEALMPWDVICDLDAPSWSRMRWIGHRYSLPMAEARRRWPGKRWSVRGDANETYLRASGRTRSEGRSLPEGLRPVQIVEMYDLVAGKLGFWSGDLASAGLIEVVPMPLTEPGTAVRMHPYVQIAAVVEPDAPVRGLSTISAIADGLREKNILRSAQANNTRRTGRIYTYNTDVFPPEALAALRAGHDGSLIGVNDEQWRQGDSVRPVPSSPPPPDIDSYSAAVETDLSKGSVLGAFARGEATKATATEIGVLAQYSSSELGRLARARDGLIVGLARVLLAFWALNDGVVGRSKGMAITGADVDREWVLTALDQASTPMSRALEVQRWMGLLPVLGELGVPPQVLLERTLQLHDLPAEWATLTAAQPDPLQADPNAGASIDDLLKM